MFWLISSAAAVDDGICADHNNPPEHTAHVSGSLTHQISFPHDGMIGTAGQTD